MKGSLTDFGIFFSKHKEICQSCTRFFWSGLPLKLGNVHESRRRNADCQSDYAVPLTTKISYLNLFLPNKSKEVESREVQTLLSINVYLFASLPAEKWQPENNLKTWLCGMSNTFIKRTFSSIAKLTQSLLP